MHRKHHNGHLRTHKQTGRPSLRDKWTGRERKRQTGKLNRDGWMHRQMTQAGRWRERERDDRTERERDKQAGRTDMDGWMHRRMKTGRERRPKTEMGMVRERERGET